MSLGLFKIDRAAEAFTKEATLALQLTNPPEEWDQEILEYAYKLHPWLSDFSLTVQFINKLPDRLYGLGGIAVLPQKPIFPVQTSSAGYFGQPNQSGQTPLAYIPVIVKEGSLAPLDLFIQGEDVLPLDENSFRKRVGSALESGGATTTTRSDPTLIGHLWPPGRAIYGGPGESMGLSVMNKFSSTEDKTGFYFFQELKKLAQDELADLSKQKGIPLIAKLASGECRADLGKAAGLSDMVANSSFLKPLILDTLNKIVASLPPPRPARGAVLQVMDMGGGDLGARTTDPDSFSFSSPVAIDIIHTDQTLYCSAPATAKIKTGKSTSVSFERPAVCDATVLDGQSRRKGTIFSTVVDLNGAETGRSLFTDGTRWCLESTLNAEVGKEKESFIGSNMSGTGVFIFTKGDGLVCTLPMTVVGIENTAYGTCHKCIVHGSVAITGGLPLDSHLKVYVAQGVASPIYTSESRSLVVPAGWKWFPIGETKFKPYAPFEIDKDVVTLKKLASNEYSLQGDPVAAVVRRPIGLLDAQLVLTAIGIDPAQVPDVIAKSASTEGVRLVDCRTLREKIALAPVLGAVDGELLKAAAVIDDPNTMDSVMGLNMMDSDTEDNFFILAQNLEQTQQKVAKLLLLSRLGMYSIPEGAAKVVMSRLTPIIDALRIVTLQSVYAG